MGDGLLLLPPDANAPADYLWGSVTTVSPLAVRLDGDTVPTIASEDLSGPRELGDRVYCQMANRRLTILGPASKAAQAATLRLTATADASPTSAGHALQIGPDTGGNLRFDSNEIMAVSNGSPAALYLNNEGGGVSIGNNRTADDPYTPDGPNSVLTRRYLDPVRVYIFSAATGWSLVSEYTYVSGRTVTSQFQVTRTGAAVSVGANGDIGNQLMLNIAEGYRPVNNTPIALTTTGPLLGGYAAPNGLVYLAAIAPNSSINTDATFQLGSVWII